MNTAGKVFFSFFLLVSLAAVCRSETGDDEPPERTVQFSVLPSLPPVVSEKSVNRLSVEILFGITSRITGLQIGTGIGAVERYSSGVQIGGIGSFAGETFSGIQSGGLFAFTAGTLRGWQFTPGVGGTGEHMLGFQSAGLANIAGGDVLGVQAAGVLNRAGDVHGIQVGLVNIADDVHGAQIGLINVADSVSGLPLGLVNLVNRGYTAFPLWIDFRRFAFAGFQYGGNLLYTILYGGLSLPPEREPSTVLAGFGLGAHAAPRTLFFDADVSLKTWTTSASDRSKVAFTEHFVPSLRFSTGGGNRFITVFAGISLDAVPDRAVKEYPFAGAESGFRIRAPGVTMIPSLFAGLRL